MVYGLLALLAGAAWMLYYARAPLNISPSAQDVTIKPNSGLKSIAQQLVDQQVIKSKWPFIILAKALNKETYLQAGEYTLN